MGRTKGSKNKTQNTNTAKNKNTININVNSSTKKKGRGRPRRTNDTSPNRNFSGGGIGNAPQQVIVSQPQPDNNNSNNSLLSSFITSKLLNDTMSLNRTNIEPPAPIREQPSYFNARESIIPRFPDTPVKNVINEVKPLESTGPPAPPAPPKPPPIPPKTAAQNTEPKATMADVLKELEYNQSEEGKAEKARKKAEAAAKKLEKQTSPPKSLTEAAAKKETAPPQNKEKDNASSIIGAAVKRKVVEVKKEKDNASSIIKAAIKRKAASQIVKNIKEKPIKTIQAIYRGNKERNKLANDKDFQNRIDMKIKKYGDAASEYKTRGADAPDINEEFSDIMKTMRTGLKNYKTTLGTQPKKRGPKPKNLNESLK